MHPNTTMIANVARHLGALREQCVFVGGATVPFFLTDLSAPSPRPTKDVDVIVKVASRVYYYALAEQRRTLGFQEDTESNVLCRWKINDNIIDVMPIDTSILGFTNRWYKAALETANILEIEHGLQILLISPPYFIATKIEAFLGRGRDDFLTSRDMEDIVTILDGRSELVQEISATPKSLRSALAVQFREWLQNDDFQDALAGHMLPDSTSQARVPILLKRITEIADLS